MKICLYTAIFGNYETLKLPVKIEGLDYICFTDNKNLTSNFWSLKYVDYPQNISPALAYKKVKCFPDKYLPDYDITIWLDANFVVIDDNYLKNILDNFESNKLILYKHKCLAGYKRNCAYQEGVYSTQIPKYSKEKIKEQLLNYKNNNFPENYGLYQSGFLLRNNKDTEVKTFNKLWFDEIKKFGVISPQCQISLPFVLWKTGIKFDILENIWDTSIYEITNHGNNSKFPFAYLNH